MEKIQKELEDVEGMIDISVRRKEIEKELQDLVTNNESMKLIVAKLDKLKTELKIDSDEDFVKYRKDRIEGQQQGAKAKEAAAEPEPEPVDVDDIELDDSESESDDDEEA